MHNVHTSGEMAASDLQRWMGTAMRQAREKGGLRHVDIASRVGREEPKTVKRWEAGENWPQPLDLVLGTYANAGGYEGPRELCEAALALWREHDERSPTQRVEDAALGAGADTTPLPDEPQEKPDAKPTDEEAA